MNRQTGEHGGSGASDAARPAHTPPASAGVLWLACGAQFMVVLDASVVNVALPDCRADLGFDPVGLQWVVNGYALAFAGFLLLAGRLADILGRRLAFLAGVALFSLASLAGGLATSPGLLVAMRAVQGLGAAVLAPATLTLLTTSFEGSRRTRALALWSAVGSAGGAAGNLLGGMLTEAAGWRSTLLINVPLGAAAAFAAVRLLPAGRPRGTAAVRLDLPGALLSTAGTTALVYGLARAQTDGWADRTALAGLAGGAVALAAFVLVETRGAKEPLLPPAMMRLRPVWSGNMVMLAAGACFIPMWYFLSLAMQEQRGYGALACGLAFLPHTLAGIAGARLAPLVMARLGARGLTMAAALLAAAGFAWQSRAGAHEGYVTGLLAPGLLMSTGMGLMVTPLVQVTSQVGRRDAGAASGLLNVTRQLGGSLGLAVLVGLGTAGSGPDLSYRTVFLAIAVLCTGVAALAGTMPPPVSRSGRAAGEPKAAARP